MVSTRRQLISLGSVALLGACAEQAVPSQSPGPTAPVAPTVSVGTTPPSAAPSSVTTPTPTSATPSATSATPTASSPATTLPTGGTLKAGANHSVAAAPYVYDAGSVHTWLQQGGGPGRKVAFLTFDDGPNNTLTPLMMDTLRQLGVPATFFVIGKLIAGAASLPVRAIADGHSVCLHSYSHDYKTLYPGRVGSGKAIASDFDKALAAARAALGAGYATKGYRYPGGHQSWKGLAEGDAALAARGVSWIDWNCMSGDADAARPSTAQGMVNLMASELASGPQVAVVLNHDADPTGRLTREALPGMVGWLRDHGYGFGVIS